MSERNGAPAVGETAPDGGPADVALVISDIRCGGAQRVVSLLANAWVRRGLRVRLITQSAPDTDALPLDSGVVRRCIGGVGDAAGTIDAVLRNLGRIRRLRRELESSGAPVAVSFIVPTNILTILAGQGLPCRIVVSERNDPGRQSFGVTWDVLRRLLYRRADVVAANSRKALRALRAYVRAERLAFLPNPTILPPEDELAHPAHARRVLDAGRLVPQKGHDVLLEAFARAVKERPAWRLDIVGDGPLRADLSGLAETLGIADKVVWHGEPGNIRDLYRGAALFALASRYEGMANTLIEAMSYGLPSVVTDASSEPLDGIGPAETAPGAVVPVDDVCALARALARFMDDADLRAKTGMAARAHAAAYDVDTVIAEWDALLHLGDAPSGGARRIEARN